MRKLAPFVLIAGFVALLVPRMMQSMAQGDAYPEWSTLRSDPLGAKVLYVALERMGGVAVSRNYEPWKEARAARALYVMLGVSPLFLQDSKEIGQLTAAGGEVLAHAASHHSAANAAA